MFFLNFKLKKLHRHTDASVVHVNIFNKVGDWLVAPDMFFMFTSVFQKENELA